MGVLWMANSVFNPNEYIAKIAKLKRQYTDIEGVDATNDEEGIQKKSNLDALASEADGYYKQLTGNGYKDVADNLRSKGANDAVTYQDAYGSSGLEQTRPYLDGLMKKNGATGEYAFDEGNENVRYGGSNLGKADYVSSDGKSYYKRDTLDKFANKYATDTGAEIPVGTLVNRQRTNMAGGYDTILNELLDPNYDKFGSSTAKSIMKNYGIKGDNAFGNEIATVGGDNGGNIDSFSKANALRQKASMNSLGEQSVIADYNNRVTNVRGILSDMGVNVGNMVNQNETKLNGEVTRKETVANGITNRGSVESQTTGNVPLTFAQKESGYFKDDGTLNNYKTDFGTIIKNAEEALKTTTDVNEKAKLQKIMSNAQLAVNYKLKNPDEELSNDPQYNEYLKRIVEYNPTPNATTVTTDKTLASNAEVNRVKTNSDLIIAGDKNETALKVADIKSDSAVKVADKKVTTTTPKPKMTQTDVETAFKNEGQGIIVYDPVTKTNRLNDNDGAWRVLINFMNDGALSDDTATAIMAKYGIHNPEVKQ